MILEHIQPLGHAIETRWRAAGKAPAALRGIATEQLARLAETAGALHSVGQRPRERANAPAEPTLDVRVFDDCGIIIEVLDRTRPHASLQLRDTAGVSLQLFGRSVVADYDFDSASGDVRLETVQVLQPGETRQLTIRENGLQAIFHLDAPSTSILVREKGGALRPNGAACGRRSAANAVRRPTGLSALKALEGYDVDAFDSAVLDRLRTQDPAQNFWLLSCLSDLLLTPKHQQVLLAFVSVPGREAANRRLLRSVVCSKAVERVLAQPANADDAGDRLAACALAGAYDAETFVQMAEALSRQGGVDVLARLQNLRTRTSFAGPCVLNDLLASFDDAAERAA